MLDLAELLEPDALERTGCGPHGPPGGPPDAAQRPGEESQGELGGMAPPPSGNAPITLIFRVGVPRESLAPQVKSQMIIIMIRFQA